MQNTRVAEHGDGGSRVNERDGEAAAALRIRNCRSVVTSRWVMLFAAV